MRSFLKNSVPVTFAYIWYFKRVIIVATKFEKSKVFLIATIWLPSPLLFCNAKFCGGLTTRRRIFFFLHLNLCAVSKNSTPRKSTYIWRIEGAGLTGTMFERTPIYFIGGDVALKKVAIIIKVQHKRAKYFVFGSYFTCIEGCLPFTKCSK